MPYARLLYAGLTSLALISAVPAATIPVTTTVDTIDTDGSCSLREAIIAANTDSGGVIAGECPAGDPAGQDQIVFDIPGTGPHQIFVQSELPTIVSSLSIDGYTQPGSSPNTIADLSGFNAVLMVEINGTQSGPATKPGLTVNGSSASNSIVRGLRVTGFTSAQCCADIGISIKGSGISNVKVLGNRIDGNRHRGIFTLALGNPHVGLEVGGPNPADRNAIDGALSGEAITLNDCNQCKIQNNWIGLSPDAAGLPVAGGQGTGLFISFSPGIQVLGNWIGASSTSAMQLRAGVEQALVQGNLIGGTAPNGSGILLVGSNMGAPSGNRIDNNRITGNTGIGLVMTNNVAGLSLRGNVVRGNRIYANGGVEIDLGADGGAADGISANDAGDGDAGPNGRQNYPILSNVHLGTGLSTLDYAMDSDAASYDVEIVFSSQCDASGHGPGGQILADPLVFDGVLDQGTLSFLVPVPPGSGYVSALATATDIGTSEYSACVPFSYSDELLRNGFE